MKKVFISIAAMALATSAFAGGLLTNTNQNAHFLRNPARGASTEIDAVYSNPAGLSFMEHEGLTLSLNNQSAFQTRTITSTFAPFAMNGGNATKEYEGKATAPFIPSLQAAYKTGDWVFSGSFAMVGGGGTLKFDDGLPSFEAMTVRLLGQNLATPIGTLNGAAAQSGYAGEPLALNGYSLKMNLEGSSMTYGFQLGAGYKINDYFSAFIGGRLSIVNNGYKGSLGNVNFNIANTSDMKTHFTNTAAYLESVGMTAQAEAMQQAAAGVTQLEQGDAGINYALDTKQSGWGIAPILGINFNYEKLNVGIKYDFMTNIELENETAQDIIIPGVYPDGMFPNGKKDSNGKDNRYDIPALLSVGASYKFFEDKLIASTGFHFFFDKDAKMTGDRQKALGGTFDGNSYEILAGLEYNINDKFLVSAGGQFSRYGLKDAAQSDMTFNCNSYSVGLGGAYNITDKLTLNLAYLITMYDDFTKNNPYGPGSKEAYTRTNNVFGIGLDYKF